ncbi:MAG: site-specific integrase [Chloroflexota bacterium]
MLAESLTAFLDHLTVEKGASPHTVAAYRNDLTQLTEYVADAHRDGRRVSDWAHVDHKLLGNYVVTLYERGYSAATVARKVASIKSFFGYLAEEGQVSDDPTEQLASPRIGRTLPKFLSVEEVQHLLEEPGRVPTPDGVRDTAMLELLYASGLRVSEMMNLNIRDVNWPRGT